MVQTLSRETSKDGQQSVRKAQAGQEGEGNRGRLHPERQQGRMMWLPALCTQDHSRPWVSIQRIWTFHLPPSIPGMLGRLRKVT